MWAVLLSFDDGRRINALGREFLQQLQLLREGFWYDFKIRGFKHHELNREIENQENVSKQVLKRALIAVQKTESIEDVPFLFIVFTVQCNLPIETVDETWRYAYDASRAYHIHDPDEKIQRNPLPSSAQEQVKQMQNILRMGYSDVC